MPPRTDLGVAWAAGFFDGEGSLHLKTSGRTFVLSATVSQVDRRPLDRLLELFGGRIYGPYKQRTTKHSEYFVYTRWTQGAYEFLSLLRPFLVTKGEQVDVGLAYHEFYLAHRTPGVKTTPEVHNQRSLFRAELQAARYRYATKN